MNFSKHWAAAVDDYVIDLGWSPDGARLAVASAAGGVTLYDTGSGAVRHAFAAHDDGANALAWSPDGALLATGGQDGKVKLWQAADGLLAHEFPLGSAWVEHLAWSSPAAGGGPWLLASAGKKFFALRPDGTIAHAFPDAPKTVTALAGRPDGGACAVAYFGGVAVWDTEKFALRKEYPYGNTIHALAWSPDARWLVAGCQDNAVHLWAPADDTELHMSGYETKLRELSFSPDGKWLATGGGRDACVWDCSGPGPEGREPVMLPHQARVVAVAFQNQHGLLATAAADGEFLLWSPARKNPIVAQVKMPSAATKFAWHRDDSLLAVGTGKGAVYTFKVGAA